MKPAVAPDVAAIAAIKARAATAIAAVAVIVPDAVGVAAMTPARRRRVQPLAAIRGAGLTPAPAAVDPMPAIPDAAPIPDLIDVAPMRATRVVGPMPGPAVAARMPAILGVALIHAPTGVAPMRAIPDDGLTPGPADAAPMLAIPDVAPIRARTDAAPAWVIPVVARMRADRGIVARMRVPTGRTAPAPTARDGHRVRSPAIIRAAGNTRSAATISIMTANATRRSGAGCAI
ncbi:hypothetical protein C7435_2859 [Maricaulis maris]|uniref:Uncharacterized protein n=1 Tax=Maricaulis maris TaxID=74318 RepID=A0A495D0X0_9PROT|nr:hypothetical protein C7435_2859 [Maricaulis maris]